MYVYACVCVYVFACFEYLDWVDHWWNMIEGCVNQDSDHDGDTNVLKERRNLKFSLKGLNIVYHHSN